jgi:hypothetical protein
MNGALGDLISLLDFAIGHNHITFHINASSQFKEIATFAPKNVKLKFQKNLAFGLLEAFVNFNRSSKAIYVFAGGRLIPENLNRTTKLNFPNNPKRFKDKFEFFSQWLNIDLNTSYRTPIPFETDKIFKAPLIFSAGGNIRNNSGFKNIQGPLPNDWKVARFTKNHKNLTAYSNIPELIMLLQKHKNIMSVDSAPLYLGLFLGVNVIGIFGPTSVDYFLNSYVSQPRYLKSDFTCTSCYEGWNVNMRHGCILKSCMNLDNFNAF